VSVMSKVAASVLAADIMEIGQDVQRILSAGADMLHIDIMDAHFVPNLSFGPSLVAGLRKRFAGTFLDVHLMMDNPAEYISVFRNAGADAITVHAEAIADLPGILSQIKASGARCGVSIKPLTPAESIRHVLQLADIVLVMTVEPGFGGQSFMPDMLGKIVRLRSLGYIGQIAADGGVGMGNAQRLADAGVDILVMGVALFSGNQPNEMIKACHGLEGKLDKRQG
jgi:ribulose-phosphate 3-epimerase